MVRYFMSFSVPEGRQQSAQQVINMYFDALSRQGPGGMRSQCYASHGDRNQFVHIKSFRKEAIANHHFKSALFREYITKLTDLCGDQLSFSRLQQQHTFESIY